MIADPRKAPVAVRALYAFVLTFCLLFVSPGIFDAIALAVVPPVATGTALSLGFGSDSVSSPDQPNSVNPASTVGTPASSQSASSRSGSVAPADGIVAAGAAVTANSSVPDEGKGTSATIAKGQMVTIDQKVPSLKASPINSVVNGTVGTVKDVAGAAVDTVATDVKNLITQKEMSRFEKIFWGVAKAVVPTLAVIAFAATVACPVTWLVVGSIAIGALAGGGMSLLGDARENMFRSDENKKSTMEMVRDASISAVANGVAAPFTLVGGSIVAQAGKFTITSVMKTAALSGATAFASGVASKGAGGLTKKAWNDLYFKNGEKMAAKESELQTLLSKYKDSKSGDVPPEDLDKMMALQQDIEKLRKQDYTLDDFTKDVKTSAIDGVIGGFLGGAATHLAGSTKIARAASMKVFKDTAHAGQIAQVVVSNPFNFASGAAKAQVDKDMLSKQIGDLAKERDKYPEGSASRAFYDLKIGAATQQRDSIDILERGKSDMLNALVVNGAGLGISALKTRAWDLPRARKKAVSTEYESQNPEWKKANDAKGDYVTARDNPPKKADFATTAEYEAALSAHKTRVAGLRDGWKSQEKLARISDDNPANQALKKELLSSYDQNKNLEQRLEMARIFGEESYRKANVELIKERGKIEEWKNGKTFFVIREKGKIQRRIELDPADPQGSLTRELDKLVTANIRVEYGQKAAAQAAKAKTMEEKLKDFTDLSDGRGKVETWNDGSRHYIVRNDKGKIETNIKIDPRYGDWKQQPEIKRIEAAGYTVKPSTYKATLVDRRISELKSQGLSDAEIRSATPQIVKDADQAMLAQFGGSWIETVKHEAVASQLATIKYDGNVSGGVARERVTQMLMSQPEKYRRALISSYMNDVNKGIKDSVVPLVDTGQEFGDDLLKTVLDKTVATTTDIARETVEDDISQRYEDR